MHEAGWPSRDCVRYLAQRILDGLKMIIKSHILSGLIEFIKQIPQSGV